MPANLLLTGPSGAGKSTLLRKAVEQTRSLNWRGFICEEIVEGPQRFGWMIEGLGTGIRRPLIHTDLITVPSLGKFGVNTALFEGVAGAELAAPADAYAIDEIGLVSSWLPRVEAAMESALSSNVPTIAIVREKGGGLADSVGGRPDVQVWQLSMENRDEVLARVVEWVTERDFE